MTKKTQKKAAKNGKTQSRMRTAGHTLSTKPRSPDSIIKALTTRSRPTSSLPPYVACRLNPFRAGSGRGIPDGGNSNYIVVDHLMFDDILCVTSAGFVIQTLPALPFMATICGQGGTSANDVTVNGILYKNSGSYYTGQYPLSIPPVYGANIARFDSTNVYDDPFVSSSARLVSLAYRLIYTGAVQTCAGVITVSPNNIGASYGGSSDSNLAGPAADTTTVAYVDPLQGPAYYNQGVNTINLDYVTNVKAYTKDTISMRPEESPYMLAKHRTNDFKLLPTLDVTQVPISNASMVGALATGTVVKQLNSSVNPSAQAPGMIWIDPDWSAMQIVVSGVNIGATFRLETAACFEYALSSTSPFATLAIKSSETNLAQVAMGKTMSSAMPTAVPNRDPR